MPLAVEMVVPLPCMEAAVEGLVLVNLVILERLCSQDAIATIGTPPPRLYQSAVRYRRPGKRQWHTIANLYDKLEGDCKDLAAARCAELRFYDGEMATPIVYLTRRRHRYHAIVRRADGSTEDPSLVVREMERRRTGHVEIIR